MSTWTTSESRSRSRNQHFRDPNPVPNRWQVETTTRAPSAPFSTTGRWRVGSGQRTRSQTKRSPCGFQGVMERVMGIEPTLSAWEADVLPSALISHRCGCKAAFHFPESKDRLWPIPVIPRVDEPASNQVVFGGSIPARSTKKLRLYITTAGIGSVRGTSKSPSRCRKWSTNPQQVAMTRY